MEEDICYSIISFIVGKAIGTGKSHNSKMIGLYMYHRMDCCTNIYKSLGLSGGSKLAAAFFHANYDSAMDFVNYFKFVFDTSPYFRNQYHGITKNVRVIASGPQANTVIGTQLVFSVK